MDNLNNLINDQNEEIRKFAIKNLRDLSETNQKILNTYLNTDIINTLINYFLNSTKCEKELFEIMTIIINTTYENNKISEYILKSHLSLIIYFDNFLSNYLQNYDVQYSHLALNNIIIITNLICDNNSKKLNLEQTIFECFNIAILFKLFQDLQKLPNFLRIKIIWLFTNCLKVKKSDTSVFHKSYWREVENFLSKDFNLDILIKFFNFPTITKMTTEILYFLLALFDLQNEFIYCYLEKNLNFENKVLDILRCFPDINTLILTLKLMNKISNNEFSNSKFFQVYDVIMKFPFLIDYIEKELLKNSSGNINELNSKNLNGKINNFYNKTITYNQEIIKLLDCIIFFLSCFIEKKKSVGKKIIDCNEMFYVINRIFMFLTKNGISKSIDSSLENYLFIISILLNSDNNMIFFFECIRCNVLDFLTDLIRKVNDNKNILHKILKCLEMMLNLADNLDKNINNIIEKHLEKLGLDSDIDKFRSDNNDNVASVANSICESYFLGKC